MKIKIKIDEKMREDEILMIGKTPQITKYINNAEAKTHIKMAKNSILLIKNIKKQEGGD